MTAGPTPSDQGQEDKKKYQRRDPYTSPYWDSYNQNDFTYAKDQIEDRASAYGRYYPDERSEYGCGWEGEYGGRGGSQAGWRRALQDPSLAAIGLVVGAIGTYLLYTAIPTAGFGGKRKRDNEESEFDHVGDWLWSGKIHKCLP